MLDLVEHLSASIDKANSLVSKLEIRTDFPTLGMSGLKGRALLNNLCSGEEIRYLEVGLWQGSTFFSALYRNKIRAVGIDNWSEFNGPKEYFKQEFGKYAGNNRITVKDIDCFAFQTDEKFNILFYDGEHSVQAQYCAIAHFGPMMDQDFILLVDDFKSPEVSVGTYQALEDMGYDLLSEFELGMSDTGHEDEFGWWNGMFAGVVRKSV